MTSWRWWLLVLSKARLIYSEPGEWHRLGLKKKAREHEEWMRDYGGEG